MRVEVYYNLHRRCLSVRHRGRVIAHVPRIALSDCTFVVQSAGRERVRREGRKNVHAFVRGTWEPSSGSYLGRILCPPQAEATYNPYRFDTFVDKASLAPVHEAKHAVVDGRKVRYAR